MEDYVAEIESLDAAETPEQIYAEFETQALCIAKRFFRVYGFLIRDESHCVTIEDVDQIARTALWNAIITYDPAKGNRLGQRCMNQVQCALFSTFTKVKKDKRNTVPDALPFDIENSDMELSRIDQDTAKRDGFGSDLASFHDVAAREDVRRILDNLDGIGLTRPEKRALRLVLYHGLGVGEAKKKMGHSRHTGFFPRFESAMNKIRAHLGMKPLTTEERNRFFWERKSERQKGRFLGTGFVGNRETALYAAHFAHHVKKDVINPNCKHCARMKNGLMD